MQTDSDIFSSPQAQDPEMARSLTERLYSGRTPGLEKDPYAHKTDGLADLRKLLEAQSPAPVKQENGALEKSIQNFQQSQAEKAKQYLQLVTQKEESCLYYLNGWALSDSLYLTERSRKSSSGLFLRWNGKGVVINPGRGFLHHFHREGLHIRDIDFVIVTSDQPDCYADVSEIYELAYQLNKLSEELQIIHYYFHQKAFQNLSSILKPHFKQERHSLHCLELFVDSSDVEKVDLAEGLVLHYFQTASRDPFPTSPESKMAQGALGIRLDLGKRRIGYMAHAAWNPLLAHQLGPCDLLICGFGNTGSQDYQKLAYLSDCLGYYGTATLLEEVAPRLLLMGEFGGREGDIRLELAQKMRSEATGSHPPVILPADTGLCVNLETLLVRCSVSGIWIENSQVKVVKTGPAFGPLAYLSSLYVY